MLDCAHPFWRLFVSRHVGNTADHKFEVVYLGPRLCRCFFAVVMWFVDLTRTPTLTLALTIHIPGSDYVRAQLPVFLIRIDNPGRVQFEALTSANPNRTATTWTEEQFVSDGSVAAHG